MSCLCTQKVSQTVADLLSAPLAALDLPPIPDVLTQLGQTPGGGSPVAKMSDVTKEQLADLLDQDLPPLTVDPMVLAQLQSVIPTVQHVKNTLGVNLLAAKPADLGPIMKQANAALPGLMPLADLDPGPLMTLAAVLMLLDALKNCLGVNLMKPGGKPALAQALQAAPVFPVAPLQAAAPYGVLATVMSAFSLPLTAAAMTGLADSLSDLAEVPIPPLEADPAALAKISGLLMATSVSKQLLGFNPVGNAPRLALTLGPLQELEGLTVSDTLAEAALANTLIATVLPLLKLKLTAASSAALPTSVPADLPIPDLSDAATAGSVMSYGLGSSKACSESCGMAGQFAPTGLLGRVGSLFS